VPTVLLASTPLPRPALRLGIALSARMANTQ
jgi:hypothetical protein